MEIVRFTVGDLARALQEDSLWSTEVLPITRHRAESHVHNPRANPGDTSLLIAYERREVAGYIGMLPDAFFRYGDREPMAWLSTWWVDPRYASTGVGLMLLLRALAAYDGRIGVYDFSDTAAKVYDTSRRFVELQELDPIEVTVADAAGVHAWLREGLDDGCRWERVAGVDEATAAFLEAHDTSTLSRRRAPDLRWILAYPWVLSPESAFPARDRYYFSSSAARFEFHGARIRSSSGEILGFVLFRVRDDQLAVPYVYAGDEALSLVWRVVLDFFATSGATTLTVVSPALQDHIRRAAVPGIALAKAYRRTIVSKSLASLLPRVFTLQDGDGDSVFT